MKIGHIAICVDEDTLKNVKFKGTLDDYICSELNAYFDKFYPDGNINVINIIRDDGTAEIRPRLDSSSTWYKIKWVQIIAYYQVL